MINLLYLLKIKIAAAKIWNHGENYSHMMFSSQDILKEREIRITTAKIL